MFDSVMPTRIARNGTLYTSEATHYLPSRFRTDQGPLDPSCSCYVCARYSRSYLRHLYHAGEIAALIYNTHHNLHFMKSFMEEARAAIIAGTFGGLLESGGAPSTARTMRDEKGNRPAVRSFRINTLDIKTEPVIVL